MTHLSSALPEDPFNRLTLPELEDELMATWRAIARCEQNGRLHSAEAMRILIDEIEDELALRRNTGARS